jgi:hypothetical protein
VKIHYGRAHPEKTAIPARIPPQAIVPLQYRIPARQSYVATELVTADLFWSPTQTRRTVVVGRTRYYQIFFNHRLAFVKANDVDVKSASTNTTAVR